MARKATDERQKEILDVSLKILHEKGHSALTVRNIAERIGVSEPAVYRHFDDKEEIIHDLAKKIFSEDRMPDDLQVEGPEELFYGIISGIFKSLQESPETTAILFHGELFSQYPQVQEIFREHRREKKRQMTEMLEKTRKDGMLQKETDPEYLSTIIMGSVRFSVLEWRESGFDYDISERAEPLAKEITRIAKD